MARNFGKMQPTPIKVPAIHMFKISEDAPNIVLSPERTAILQGNEDGETWFDLTKDIPQVDGQWFIAVHEGDGFIACCERDPTMISLYGYDLWQIEHPGPREAIFCKYWDGEKVVEAKPEPPENVN